MIKELFKKQIYITSIDKKSIDFKVNWVLPYDQLERGAINELLAVDTSYKLSSADKIYFMPGCVVPRFKVKQYCESTGLSVSKTIDNANIIIKGDGSESEIVDDDSLYYRLPTKKFASFIKKNFDFTEHPFVKALFDLLADPDLYPFVSLSGWSTSNTLKDCEEWDHVLSDVDIMSSNHRVWKSTERSLNDLDKIIASGKTILHEDVVLQIIGETTIMDKEMYDELNKMFDSHDVNNHVLAMEVMANCNFEKSALYLLSLFKKNRNSISSRTERNHVNFKSLCKFFGVKPGEYLSLDSVIEIAKNKNLITKEEIPTLMYLAKEELEEDLRQQTDHFNIGEISINSDLSEAIEKADQLRLAKENSIQDVPQDLNNI